MELARYRDMTRIYLLVIGAFSITFFVRWVMIGYLTGGAVGAVVCGTGLFIFLLLGIYILYFGLESWDRFYTDMTVPLPVYPYPAYYPPAYHPPPGQYYPQPAYLPPPGYYYPQPAYYPPAYGQPAYGMPAPYPQYHQYPPPGYHYPPAYVQPGYQYQPAYGQPVHSYPPVSSPPVHPYQPAYQYRPPPVYQPPQARELDPRRALILPDATRLLAFFLLAVLVGGLALATAPYTAFFSLLVFLPAFVIGFSFPSIIWISYVYSFEKTHLLPSKTILKAFVWGMLSTIPALIVNTAASGLAGDGEGASLAVTLFVVALVAPLIEEFSKPWGVRLVRNDLRGPLDGLILGVTCGVGFALIENISYEFSFVLTGESAAAVWTLGSLARGLGSIMVHAAGAGMIGYAYGRHRAGGEVLSIGLAYLAAVALHSAWNGSSTLFATVDWGLFATAGFMVLFVIGTYFLIRHLIARGAAFEEQAGAIRPPAGL